MKCNDGEKGRRMQTKIIIGMLAVMLLPLQADAKLTKYWVLKMDTDSGGASYRAFTSPEACDAAKRQYQADTKRTQARFKNAGIKFASGVKCLNHLPYGYKVLR